MNLLTELNTWYQQRAWTGANIKVPRDWKQSKYISVNTRKTEEGIHKETKKDTEIWIEGKEYN
jgi:hypothetical protein